SNIAQTVAGSGGMTLGAFDPSLTGGSPNAIFVPIFTLNNLAASRSRIMVGGTNSLYESTNSGALFTSIGGVVGGAPGNPFAPVTGTVSAIAYGGTAAGVAQPTVAYVGVGLHLFLRSAGAAAFVELMTYPARGGGAT